MNDQIISHICTWLLSGLDRISIRAAIRNFDPQQQLSNGDCDLLIENAKKAIQQKTSTDQRQIAVISLGYYEQIYAYANSIGNTSLGLRAMKQKEKLLGLGYGENKIIINQQSKITRIERTYDLTILSPEEHEELKTLLNVMSIEQV